MKLVRPWILLLSMLSSGCDDDETQEPLAIAWNETEGIANESAGSQNAILQLNRVSDADASVSFDLEGTAALNGDYSLALVSPVLIPAGETTMDLGLEIIDEDIIEQEDKILRIILTAFEGEALAQSDELTYTFTIEDNDPVPSDGVRFDLSWELGEGENINQVNLDLFLATNVVAEGNEIMDFDIYDLSERTSGFESILLRNSAVDGDYYAVSFYKEGSEEVDYTIGINGQSYGELIINEKFFPEDEEFAIFFGPIKKAGNTFSRLKNSFQKIITTFPHQ